MALGNTHNDGNKWNNLDSFYDVGLLEVDDQHQITNASMINKNASFEDKSGNSSILTNQHSSNSRTPSQNNSQSSSFSQNAKRIPGPIGFLPRDQTDSDSYLASIKQTIDTPDNEKETELSSSIVLKSKLRRKEKHASLNTTEYFLSPAWITMLEHLKLPPFSSDINPNMLTFNLKLIMESGMVKKIPTLVVIVKKVITSDMDARATLLDPSGEMEGTIHKQVFKSYPQLGTGAVLVLQKVSIFWPSPSSCHLNVTPDNVMQCFAAKCTYPHAWQSANTETFSPLLIYAQPNQMQQ